MRFRSALHNKKHQKNNQTSFISPTRTPKPERGTKTTKSARNSQSTSWSRKGIKEVF